MVGLGDVVAEAPHILHVVESYGAGTATAVRQYVESTPHLRHSLLRRLRHDRDHADDGELALFHEVRDLPSGTFGSILAVRHTARRLGADVVHAHSSKAGVFVRLGAPASVRVVYTPHCFASEREDLAGAARRAVLGVERLLARRTDAFAACSPRELEISRSLRERALHVLVVNIAPSLGAPDGGAGPRTAGEVVTIGRVTTQRDPDFFAELARVLQGESTLTWVGDGDLDGVAHLRAAGVEVTGWLPRSGGLARLASAEVYVHTARWDGAPMSLVEAQALGLCIVVRRCPATAGLPEEWLVDDPTAMAARVRDLLRSETTRTQNRRAWADHFADHTRERQARQLHEAWGLACTT